MNAIVPAVSRSVSNPVGFMPTTLGDAMRLAEVMSAGKLCPKHMQGDVAACFMVIEQAARWRMSPFAVAAGTSSIGGRLMYEGKLVAAAVMGSGILQTRLRYDFDGQGEDRSCTASAILHGETEPRIMQVVFRNVKTTNEFWKKQPDMQLSYSAARNWARMHTPEVILGVYSPEEFQNPAAETVYAAGPTIDITPERQPAARPAPADIPALQTDRLRDLTDNYIRKLAAKEECAQVRAMVEWADNNILVQVRDARRTDLDKMLTKAIAAARLRCPDPAPGAEDDAGDMPAFEGEDDHG